MERLVVLAGAIGLVLGAAGCGTPIRVRQGSVFVLGSSRQEVEAQLGKPETSQALPDGSRADTYRHMIRVTYGPDDRLLDDGPPPRYGPPEEGVQPLSFAEIRARCRSENPDAYHECVVRRIAIWAIE